MAGRSVSLGVVGLIVTAGAIGPAAFSMATAGCSSSSSSGTAKGGSGDGGTAAAEACANSAHAVCTEMETCTPLSVTESYGDEPTCEVRIQASCLDSLAAPSTGASPDKTEACAEAYPAYSCTDYRNKTNLPAPCLQVTGSVANGGACEVPGQCQTGFCAVVPGSACGICANTPIQGDSCAQLTSCGQLLTCTTDTLVCTSLAGQDQACETGVPCGAGLSCVAAGGLGTPGTCQTAGALVGDRCDGSEKSAPTCDSALGLYCNGMTKECAQTTFAGASQDCGYNDSTATDVACTAGSCVGSNPSQGLLGLCVARSADNGSCTVSDAGASATSAGCLPSARCVASSGGSGTCQVVVATSCP